MPKATDDEIQVEVTKFRVAREGLDRLRTVKETLQVERNTIAERLLMVNNEIDNQQDNVAAAKTSLKTLLDRT